MDSDELPHAYTCVAPHCQTPNEPVFGFEDFAHHFINILSVTLRERRRVQHDDTLNAECFLNDIVLAPVLEMCLSGQMVGIPVERIETTQLTPAWELELIRRTNTLMEEHAKSSHSALAQPKQLAEVYHNSLIDAFRVLQKLVNAVRMREEESSPFCLHDLVADPVALGEAVEDYVQETMDAEGGNFISHMRLREELIAAAASGRAVGVESEVLVKIGIRLLYIAAEIVFHTLGERRTAITLTRYCEVSKGPELCYELLCNFNQLSNQPERFLASSTLKSHLSHLPDIPPSPPIPPANPRLPPPLSLSLPFDLLNPSVDLYPERLFSPRSYVVPPRFCPIDECSGRSPIEENFKVVEKLLVALSLWKLQEELLLGIKYDDMTAAVMAGVVYHTKGIEVETEEEKQRLMYRLSSSLAMVKRTMRRIVKHEAHRLTTAIMHVRKQLRTINDDRRPCVCDLTHCVDALTSAVESAKAAFDVEAARPLKVITPATVDTSRLAQVVAHYLDGLDFLEADSVERKSKLNKLVLFLNEPLHELLSPVVRLDAFAALRQLVQHLGGAGLLELSFAIGSGDFRASGAEIQVQPFPAISSILAHAREEKTIADVLVQLQSEAREKYRARDLDGSLFAYVQLGILTPLDWQSRLNSAAIRLCLANDSDRHFQWSRAIYDCSMAIYYGPPNFKAFYRRAVALAHLRMWPKAIADFGEALKIEPKNPVAKQQLTLVRMKRS